jgi:glutamyl-tRNA reductase
MDDLDAVTASTTSSRAAAAREAEAIIDEELEHLLYLYKRRRADAAISTMYEAAAAVRDREVATALNQLDTPAEDEATREVVESMADAIIGQLLAAPTRSLRDAAVEDDWETIQTAMTLFDPNFSRAAVDAETTEDERAPTGGPPEGVVED